MDGGATIVKILELFSGTGSIARSFKNLGAKTLTLDLDNYHRPDINLDVMQLDYRQWKPGEFDFVWASPPCTCFSRAAGSKYFTSSGPRKTTEFQKALDVVSRTIEIISYLEPRYWLIENPVGHLRNMDIMKTLPRHTVTYCRYGYMFQKATDLWGIMPMEFRFLSCHAGDLCHQSNGWRRMPKERRAVIPDGLAYAVAYSIMSELQEEQQEWNQISSSAQGVGY